MADEDAIAARVYDDDSEEWLEIPVDAARNAILALDGNLAPGMIDEDEFDAEMVFPGLIALNLKIFEQADDIPIGEVNIKEGPVYMFLNDVDGVRPVFVGSKEQVVKNEDAKEASVLVEPVSLAFTTKEGEEIQFGSPLFRIEINGSLVTLNNVVFGIVFTRGVIAAFEEMLKERDKRRHRTHAPAIKGVDANLDPISKAVMGRHGKNSIGPEAYWNEDGVQIPTGNGGFATVSIRPGENVSIDTPYSAYQLNERDRYWHDHASTLFYAGQTEVTGSQILKLCGFSNPYTEEMIPTMKEAAESLTKGGKTMIAIDTSKERRNARRKNGRVISAITFRPIVGAELTMEVIETDDGKKIERDFILELNGKTPEEAFPLAAYARSRGMLTTIGRDEYTFKTVRPSLEVKQAWYYIMRCVHQEKRSNTILFDTMWQDLELPEPEVSDTKKDGKTKRTPLEMEHARKDAIRKKRERILKQLQKMLDESVGAGRLKSWKCSTDRKTGKPNGFKITPVKKDGRGVDEGAEPAGLIS